MVQDHIHSKKEDCNQADDYREDVNLAFPNICAVSAMLGMPPPNSCDY